MHGHWTGCVQLVCCQASLWKVSLKASSFMKRHGREGKRSVISFFSFSSTLHRTFLHPFPTVLLLSPPTINWAGKGGYRGWGRWTWEGNCGPQEWQQKPSSRGIGITSNTFPEHWLARCLCHPPPQLGWPASSRLSTPTCEREPAWTAAREKFTWRGKQAVPGGGERRTGDPVKYHGCILRGTFWTEPDLGVCKTGGGGVRRGALASLPMWYRGKWIIQKF